MIKAVFFDVDGTLLCHGDTKIPSSARMVLAALRERGIRLFLATGRHPLEYPDFGGIVFDGYISINGQYCYRGDQVLYQNTIPMEDRQGLIRWLKGRDRACMFVQDRLIFANQVNDAVREYQDFVQLPLPPTAAPQRILNGPLFQVMPFVSPQEELDLLKAMPHCRATRWSHLCSDVIPREGGKAAGILRMLEHFGLAPAEAAAFGDGENDITMLQTVGLGIAMDGASAPVKAAADRIAPPPEQDGIAQALVDLGLINTIYG